MLVAIAIANGVLDPGEKLVAHRVVALSDGWVFTRGDGSPFLDKPVAREQVLGVVVKRRRDRLVAGPGRPIRFKSSNTRSGTWPDSPCWLTRAWKKASWWRRGLRVRSRW